MYPVMINLKEKKVVVIGGGKVAARKIKTLLQEGATITVVSPTLSDAIPQEAVNWQERVYQKGDLDDAKLVFACTDNPLVNAQVMADAHRSQLVNNTGDKRQSDFYNVAIASHQEVSIMISTSGVSPARSKEIRKKIEELIKQL